MRRSLFRHMLLGACLSAPFLLIGCSSDEGVPQNFPPLRYTYLAPISLNVSAIREQVAYAPSQDGDSLDAASPEPPIEAVQQMLQDRLVAGGNSGTATATINTASLNRVDDTVVGNVSVELSVTSADGRRSEYAIASVTRTRTLPDDTSDDALRAFLYTMTSDLVNAEDVELEYQIRQHLADWLVGGTSPVIGGPAAPAPVEAEPLGSPGSPALGSPALGSPTVGAAGFAPPTLSPPAPLNAPAPLGAPAPVLVPPSAPSYAPAAPPLPMTAPPAQPQGDNATPTMPSGDLGLPQGNPVPLTPPAPPVAAPSSANQLTPPQPPAAPAPTLSAPATLSPPPSAPPPAIAAPAARAAAPAPAANSATLPPLPPTITP